MNPDWDSLPIFPLVSKIRSNQLLGKGEVQTLAHWFSKCAPKLASALLQEMCLKLKFLGPTLDFLDQKLWGWGSASCFNTPSR